MHKKLQFYFWATKHKVYLSFYLVLMLKDTLSIKIWLKEAERLDEKKVLTNTIHKTLFFTNPILYTVLHNQTDQKKSQAAQQRKYTVYSQQAVNRVNVVRLSMP